MKFDKYEINCTKDGDGVHCTFQIEGENEEVNGTFEYMSEDGERQSVIGVVDDVEKERVEI